MAKPSSPILDTTSDMAVLTIPGLLFQAEGTARAPRGSCTAEKQTFFKWLSDPLAQMASDLDTTHRLMLTMAAKEGGWTGDALAHNMPLNNPFGVNQIKNGIAVGNVPYTKLSDAINYWKGKYGPRVQGVKNPADFVHDLQYPKPGQGQAYNSANFAKYPGEFMKVYSSIGNYMSLCGVQ